MMAMNEKSERTSESPSAGKKLSAQEKDAKGQFDRCKQGGTNDGVASADPRVLSGRDDGDATWPLKQDR